MNQVVIETWGDLALFSRPESKVERLTYPVPTPSAMRGLLSAIYSKPKEFYWQVNRIEVLNDIRYITIKRNEVKCVVNKTPILVEDERTQRQGVFLQDVRYRISATIVKREEFNGSIEQLYDQAIRRIRGGKCFYQPYLGTRECIAYFALSDGVRQPISKSIDLGFMVYDVFNLNNIETTKKASSDVSVFRAKMVNGVIEVPNYDSNEVLKGAVAKC